MPIASNLPANYYKCSKCGRRITTFGDPMSREALAALHPATLDDSNARLGDHGEKCGGVFQAVPRTVREVVTLGMEYDGKVEDNPFIPRAGDRVALCPHEPRPLHMQIAQPPERPNIGGEFIRWLNLCRDCGRDYPLLIDPRKIDFRVVTWTDEDAEYTRLSARGAAKA